MEKRESLVLKPLNSLGASSLESTLSSESSRSPKQTFPSSIKKLPEWLLDYANQQGTDQNNNENHQLYRSNHSTEAQSDGKQVQKNICQMRPLTENSGLGRPLWFQELLQARRHSEVLLPSSFEEEDMAYRLSSMEMDHDLGNSSDNVDIIMILDDENDEKLSPIPTNTKIGDKELKVSPTLSSSSPSSRRSSLQLLIEPRKPRSLSQFFNCNDFKLESKEIDDIFNTDHSKPAFYSDKFDKKGCSDNSDLLLTDLNGLQSSDEDCDLEEATIFKRKDRGHRDSYTAADIDLVSLDEPEMETDFIIPELPEGRELVLDIKSNWGDEDYVGFNGIEIFDLKTSSHPTIEKITCETNSKSDAKKLIDGVYRTHDDSHIWMTDYSPFNVTRLVIRFQEKISIVLIRLWNYNKSRIYSYRGIRYVTMNLDGVVIFKGEIAKAIGELVGPPERFGDVNNTFYY
uniref:KATNIP domain-containing protein n=1 Tax=Tetranychus urticae TaxID=32264 RepID=T1JSM6_TETUR